MLWEGETTLALSLRERVFRSPLPEGEGWGEGELIGSRPELRVSLLQLKPGLLEVAYLAARAALKPVQRWLRSGGTAERVMVAAERVSKVPLFDCRMCGQCVLHMTGMTCPMTCPKELRNGPCGGVRPDGRCEVKPEMTCVWVEAWERSKAMPRYGGEIHRLLPPVDRRLQGTSAWINDFTGKTGRPMGWNR
jgi:hypothetical protein